MKNMRLLVFCLMLNAAGCPCLNAQIINTIAGVGSAGYSGDGGAASAAQINYPFGVALDFSGNIYVADFDNNRIRKITPSGTITTVAGTGTAGYSGDGGAATAAELNSPTGIAVDRAGNLYISDWYNFYIRKVTPSGIISTIAGNGSPGYTGSGGAATATSLSYAYAVAVDSGGNVYIADYLNNRVRKVTPSGAESTIAGNGTAGYSGDGGAATSAELNRPFGVAVDTSGNVYISDYDNFCVRKVTSTGIITTLAGNGTVGYSGDGGPATAARLNGPEGIAIDGNGNVYIADRDEACVRKVLPSGIIFTVAGTGIPGYGGDGGPATAARLYVPTGVAATRSGELFISDRNNNLIRKVDSCAPLVVSPISGGTSVCLGSSITLTDTATGGSWTSGTPGMVTISSVGVVTGISSGHVDITYSVADGCGSLSSATTSVTVITIPAAPAALSGSSVVCRSSSITLTSATMGGTWNSSSSSIATVSSSGVVSGLSAGRAVISYTNSNICGSRSVTDTISVIQLPAVGAISGASSLCVGATVTVADTSTGGVWSSSDTTIAAVSSTGAVIGRLGGTVTLSYTKTNSCGSVSATHSITVNPLPAPGTISGSSSVCESSTITLADTATGGTWSSSNTSLATVSSSGVVTGIVAATVAISYTKTNSCGTRSAVDTITVSPLPRAGGITGLFAVCPGASITLTDTASRGSWSSSNTSIATVNGAGLVTGVAAGAVNISYSVTNSCGTSSTTHAITVNPLPIPGTISGRAAFCAGTNDTLSSTGTAGGTWSSSAAGIAAISSAGMVTGIGGGTAVLSYTVTNSCGSASATMSITVRPLPVVAAISGSGGICPSATLALHCSTSGGTWSSSDISIATVDTTGLVTAVSGGATIISYTVTNACGSTTVTTGFAVNPLPNAGTITGLGNVCVGRTTTLADTATSGFWSNANTAISTVDAAGVVTGVSAGTDTVYYTVTYACGTAIARHIITINPLPDAGTIAGTNNVCPGQTVTLSDIAAGGSWSSSNSGIATVAATGFVTGLSSGTCDISYSVTNVCGTANVTYSFTVLPSSACPTAVAVTSSIVDNLAVYPNPASAAFTLLLSSATEEEVLVRITNVTGQVVKEISTRTNNATEVNLQQPPGVYFVVATTQHGRFTRSIVIE